MLAAATVAGLSPSIAAPAAMALVSASTATVSSGLSGVGRMRPRLSFDIRANGGFPITTVKVAVPAGLGFSTEAADLGRGVRMTGATKLRTSVRRGVLVVTLKRASGHVQLTVKGPALEESRSLARRIESLVRYNNTHTVNPHTLPLKLTVNVLSATRTAIKVPVTFTFH